MSAKGTGAILPTSVLPTSADLDALGGAAFLIVLCGVTFCGCAWIPESVVRPSGRQLCKRLKDIRSPAFHRLCNPLSLFLHEDTVVQYVGYLDRILRVVEEVAERGDPPTDCVA